MMGPGDAVESLLMTDARAGAMVGGVFKDVNTVRDVTDWPEEVTRRSTELEKRPSSRR
jgi:hypothetical protein